MKTFQSFVAFQPSRRASAFTLVEMMMVVGIFLFIFVGTMVGVQLFGLRICTLEATKLTATQGARIALDHVRDTIREAKTVYVGNCSSADASSFSMIGVTNAPQVGNAVIVYPTTNTANYTVFYLDTNTPGNALTEFSVAGSVVTNVQVLTQYVTNLDIFDAETFPGDLQSSIATNYSSLDNREIIHMTLQFSQWEYPIAFVGGHTFNAFDYYQLRTKIFRRAWN